ncbi:MAG TPA: hypothetical protein O0W90_02995 [Methanocorpusculum sp.]|nr:hypothetical protein [Methanocorpusculum sp.]
MIIGVDFDNTVIDYSSLFFDVGRRLKLLPDLDDTDKLSVKSYLCSKNEEDKYTFIQGLVYGRYISYAKIMNGFEDFIKRCAELRWTVFIISHKTSKPVIGDDINLHKSALDWLEVNEIYGDDIKTAVSGVFFEESRENKISIINELRCDVFIDDLLEVLMHPDLNSNVLKIFFNPNHQNCSGGVINAENWSEIEDLIRMNIDD